MWPFSRKKDKPFVNKIALYSEMPGNEDLRDDLKAIKGARESFATDFLADPERPGVSIRHQAEYDRDKDIWNLVAVLRIGKEAGLEPGVRRETLAKTSSFFNTLHWCSALQAAMEKGADQSIAATPEESKEDWQDFKHWRVVAEEAGQACDMSGVVHPCANGKPLTDGHFSEAQLAIARKTKPPEPLAGAPELDAIDNDIEKIISAAMRGVPGALFADIFATSRKPQKPSLSKTFNSLGEIFNYAAAHGTWDTTSKVEKKHGTETKDALIIDRPIDPGEEFVHEGSIIFKNFVPDNVEAVAKNGGIILEQGGGDNLKLKAEGGGNNSITIRSKNGISIINGHVFMNNRRPDGTSAIFNMTNDKQKQSGITVKGPLGDSASLVTKASISIKDAGSDLHVTARGSFSAESIEEGANIDVGGSIDAKTLGKNGYYKAGGSVNAGIIESSTTAIAGGSVNAHMIGSRTVIDAGGSINAKHVQQGARLDAGGSINMASAETGVSTDAGGKVRIGGQKINKKLKP